MRSDDADPLGDEHGESAWVRDADYITGWAKAHDAATEFHDLLLRRGVPAAEIQASAGTGADGAGVVRLKLSPDATRWLGWVLAHTDLSAVSGRGFPEHDGADCERYRVAREARGE